MNISEYADFFDQFSKDYDGIIHINLGSGFSSCYQNACLAAEECPKIRTVDSKNLSTGQGLVVLKACELAEKCEDLDEMLASIGKEVDIAINLDVDYQGSVRCLYRQS